MNKVRLLPKKGQYRMRPHVNPFNWNFFPSPPHHSHVDWRRHFPLKFGCSQEDNLNIYCNTDKHPSTYNIKREYSLQGKKIDILDIGCGYGGLLFALAPLFPHQLILGLEIRQKIVNYVAEKIRGYRILNPGVYDNISVVRTNTMKYLCNYIPRASISKIFICFPDPHFKPKANKRRIINTGHLSEYAFLLKPQGRLYCITDVLELYNWHMEHLKTHQMFEEIKSEGDPCVQLMKNVTQQSQKVGRKGGDFYWAIFQKRSTIQSAGQIKK